MPDRMPDAIDYAKQDFWTLPCDKGTKEASMKWTHLQRRPMTTQERHAAWPNRSDRNVALICGRRAGILVLNSNIKNGHDGPATLKRLGWDRIIPATPTIATPSGGLAYCFKVPGSDFSSFPFNTHVHPKNYEGLEFRGGDDHYQLVPPSRIPTGLYTFVLPWTLEHFRRDLAELPGAILQAWVMLDRGAKIFARDEPENISKARKRPSAGALPTDLSSAKLTSRLHEQSAESKTIHSTSSVHYLSTVYKTGHVKLSKGVKPLKSSALWKRGLAPEFQVACAWGLVARDCLPSDAVEKIGSWSFRCCIPGHGADDDPSATLVWNERDELMYHDWHNRSGRPWLPMPEVYAAIVTGQLVALQGPSMATWRIRWLIEVKMLEPYPVDLPPLWDRATRTEDRVYQGVKRLFEVKGHHTPDQPVLFVRTFAAGWCGVSELTAWKTTQKLVQHQIIEVDPHRKFRGAPLYWPGKGM